MKGDGKLILRYFDARGRAQFIRYYLGLRGVAFADERVPLSADFSEWQAIRDDTALTGDFKKLPVLRYGAVILSETLVIADFLHASLGDEKRLSEQDNSRHRMLLSSLAFDVMIPVGMLLWSDRMYRGVDVADVAQQTLGRVRRHFAVLNETLEAWGWFRRAGPQTLADCLLWDQLLTASQVFGKHLELGELESLSRFFGEFPARAECLKMLEAQPCQISGRPGESEALAVIRSGLDGLARRAE